jgi:hypothetical protein
VPEEYAWLFVSELHITNRHFTVREKELVVEYASKIYYVQEKRCTNFISKSRDTKNPGRASTYIAL